ncbi:MAG: hypothetical protein L3J32_12120 [Rhizobiaceae bacterium]|nr:hypothetical protein [Rhizobiaceae bacterium]
MGILGKIKTTRIAVATLGAAIGFSVTGFLSGHAQAQGLIDPKPISYQTAGSPSGNAVDGINATVGVLGGTLDGTGNGMTLLSISTSVLSLIGIQGDLALGFYDGDRASNSAAAAVHIFWRNPGTGMVGVYGDWGYLSPVHSGRVGLEAAIYSGQWTIEGLVGVEFGQNVYAKYFDEFDVSYYVDDNTRVSLGHRFSARGNVLNVGFEKQFGDMAASAWSVFGEAEVGEDDYYQVFAGVRAYLGSGSSTTLMGRDRNNGVRVRIPRNLASVTQCANVDNPFPTPKWLNDLGLIDAGSMTETLCGSKDTLNRVSTTGIFKP